MIARRPPAVLDQADDAPDDMSSLAALLGNDVPAVSRHPGSAERDVWDWLKRVAVEFEVVRATNKRMRARIDELERLRGGVERLSEDEFVAELPKRMIRALQSAQHVSQEVVHRAQGQAELVLERAKVEAAEIRHRADLEAEERLTAATDAARSLVRKAQGRAKHLLEQARLQSERDLADLEARRSALERDISGLLQYGDELRQAFSTVRKVLQEPKSAVAGPGPTPGRAKARKGASHQTPSPEERRNGDRTSASESGQARARGNRVAPAQAPVAAPAANGAGGRRPHCNILLIGQPGHFGATVAALAMGQRLTELGVKASVRLAQVGSQRRHLPSPFVHRLLSRDAARSNDREVLSADLLRRADLVIGMTRADIDAALGIAHQTWSRAFTLKELVRRGQHSGGRQRGDSVKAYLRSHHAGRGATAASGPMDLPAQYDLDVETDGRSPQEMKRVVNEVTCLVEELLFSLWPVEMRRQVRHPGPVFDDATV